ncbi:MAG: family lipase [Phycisphaerales bacterium]|nr:family lipase [Phycisphaerales bacterium]
MLRAKWTAGVVGAVLAWTSATWAATPISVMPLGDSITAGGFRGPMATRLTSTFGYTVSTVGTQSDANLPVAQRPHEGHGGWRIDQLSDNLLGVNTVDSSAHGGYWLLGGHGTGRTAIAPNFITVMAGINDINGFIGSDTSSPMSTRGATIMSTIESRMTTLVTNLTTTLPNTKIMLGGCIPYNNGLLNDQLTGATTANRAIWAAQDGVSQSQEFGVNHWVILFNKWIRDTYVPQLKAAGKNVYYVEQYSNFILSDGSVRGWDNTEPQNTNGPAGYADYGLHPNVFGYTLMGNTWADAINTANTAAVPEPATLGAIGFIGVVLMRRHRQA